jgi:hypothetical protein
MSGDRNIQQSEGLCPCLLCGVHCECKSCKDWSVAEDGARFNPFPDAGLKNLPHLYTADNFTAAALGSVFHAVQHVPSPDYPRSQLGSWFYSELELVRDFKVFELTNPNLRQLAVPGRTSSPSGRRIDPY